ncbi:unnamed protein product [Leptosia nina]|uniref:Uncharacterized protein n=1 Tax=Leptosia nina TaxID=320188 RepID=A0AAV1K168_9NEOP
MKIILDQSLSKGILYFTAPYKICAGGCGSEEQNFHMVFPLYVGRVAKRKYTDKYSRDYKNIHSKKPDAPFKRSTTPKVWTLAPECTTVAEKPTTDKNISNEVHDVEPPSIKPGCQVRVSKVNFGKVTTKGTKLLRHGRQ